MATAKVTMVFETTESVSSRFSSLIKPSAPQNATSPVAAAAPPFSSSKPPMFPNFSTAAASTYSAVAMPSIPTPAAALPFAKLEAIVSAVSAPTTLISPSTAVSPMAANSATAPASPIREDAIMAMATPEPTRVFRETVAITVSNSISVFMLVMAASRLK